MSLIDPQSRILQSLENASLMASSIVAQMRGDDGSGIDPNMPPQFFRILASSPAFSVLINMRESGLFSVGGALDNAVSPAISAARAIAESATPDELRSSLGNLLDIDQSVRDSVREVALHSEDTPERVLGELKADFILTLTANMTGHARLVELVSKWEDDSQDRARRNIGSGKDYYDMNTFSLVSDGGANRVHMEYLRAAVESGMSTLVLGEGVRETDYTPPIQTALYGQWFTYIHSLWEDSYRGRLADSYGDAPDGRPWYASDIKSEFFSDIAKIRNDFVHGSGRANKCLKNKLITGFSKGAPIALDPAQMMGLIDKFPEKELLSPPEVRSGPAARTSLGWTASREMADRMREVVASRGLRGEQAVDEAVKLWLDEQARPEGG